MNFIPDKFILLEEGDEAVTRERIVENLRSEDAAMPYDIDHVEEMAKKAIEEYNYHIAGVMEVYKGNNIVRVDSTHEQ